MSHVDEGALHAYLDGALDEYPATEAEEIRAHLDACAECAEKLEVEREARSEAHAILAMATPNVELPSLEELRAYVKRTRPAPSRFSARVYRMGWAASVVLAVGTGWMLRDGQLATSAADAFRASQTESAFAGRSAPAPVSGVGAPAEVLESDVAGADLEESSSGGVEQVGSEAVRSGGGASVESRLVETPPVEASSFVPSRREVASDAGAAEMTDVTSVPEGLSRAAAPQADVMEPATALALNGVVVASAGPDDAAFADRAAAPPQPVDVVSVDSVAANTVAGGLGGARPAADEEAALKARAADEREAVEEERARSNSRVALTSALDQTSASRDDAAGDRDELEVLAAGAVPGLAVLDVASIGEGTMYYGSRITQRLADGSVIEVYRLEYDVEPVVLGALPVGQAEASRKIEEEWVVIRGPQSPEELEGLILRLLPEG